jgi:hypothetical protein
MPDPTTEAPQFNPIADQIAQAEQAGDSYTALALKSQRLAQLHREQDAAAAAYPTHRTITRKESA